MSVLIPLYIELNFYLKVLSFRFFHLQRRNTAVRMGHIVINESKKILIKDYTDSEAVSIPPFT